MTSKCHSHSFLQLERSPLDETDGFLPETDQGRGLCNRQPGLGDALCRDRYSQCPTSSYYVITH